MDGDGQGAQQLGPLEPPRSVSSGTVQVQPGVKIAWEIHQLNAPGVSQSIGDSDKSSRVSNAESTIAKQATKRLVLIMGFACSGKAWTPLLNQLTAIWDAGPLEILVLDNRGVGKSSCPSNKDDYSTTIMAQDVLAVMDHHKWDKAHVAGFSMGGMIATKLAALAPYRVSSLTLMSVTGGGTEVLPRTWKGWKYVLKGVFAKTPEARARVDIKFHYSKCTLRQMVPDVGRSVKELLHDEYVSSSNTAQSKDGESGQGTAVWRHKVTKQDVRDIKSGGMPVWYVHGRHDLLAMPKFAERLADRFGSPCVLVNGGHFIPRENSYEVACILKSIIAQQTLKSVIECLGLDSVLSSQKSSTRQQLHYPNGGDSRAAELSVMRLNIVVQASDVRQPLVVPA